MAGEPRQPGRSRSASGPTNDPDLTLPGSDPPIAPITANTPLPPLNLASQAGGAAPQPPPVSRAAPEEPPPISPQSSGAPSPQMPFMEATPYFRGSAITSTWAAYTTFALLFTSLILLAAMGIAYAAITKDGGLLSGIVVIIVVVDIIYPLIMFSIARPGSGQPIRLPFMSPRRGP